MSFGVFEKFTVRFFIRIGYGNVHYFRKIILLPTRLCLSVQIVSAADCTVRIWPFENTRTLRVIHFYLKSVFLFPPGVLQHI